MSVEVLLKTLVVLFAQRLTSGFDTIPSTTMTRELRQLFKSSPVMETTCSDVVDIGPAVSNPPCCQDGGKIVPSGQSGPPPSFSDRRWKILVVITSKV